MRETTINCDWAKCMRNILPMFCVCERSRAASISSRMYMGAGLKRSSDKMSDRAMSDLHHEVKSNGIW